MAGAQIRALRQRLGLSQVELAAILGVSNVTVNRWEHDRALPQGGMSQRLLRLERDGLEALRAPALAQRGNLPATFAPLVGRDADLESVPAQIALSPLLTIVGPAGAGKTRLAIESSRLAAPRWPDGVWFIDLAAVLEPDAVLHAVARALGVREAGRKSLADRLADEFRGRTLLLILDNCEHLRAACAALVAPLIATESASRLLATSRVPLDVPGEAVYSLRPLAPDDAVTLFVQRAQERQPGLTLESGDAAAIAEICRRLDGLPLAIELAAARTHVLSVAQIAGRLDRRFDLLRASGATLPRQRALDTAIGWSYDLLAPDEAALFRRLGVFAGWCDLPAVEAVAESADAIDLLDGLARQSMIVVAHDAAARSARYRLLESLAAYARRELEQSGEAAAAAARHAAYYGGLAATLAGGLRGASQAALLAVLDREHDNLIAALEWMLAAQESEQAVALAGALGSYWDRRGLYAEGSARLERALAQEPILPSSARAAAMNQLGILQNLTGRIEAAERTLTAASDLAREIDDREQEARALDTLGLVLVARREFAQAAQCHETALAIFLELGERGRAAMSRKHLGNIANLRGEYAVSERAYHEAWSLVQGTGDLSAEALILSNLGDRASRIGRYSRALGYFERALAILRTIGDPDRMAADAINTAEVRIVLGEPEAALPLADDAVTQFRVIGNKASLANALYVQGAALAAVGRRGDALACFRESLALFHELDDWIDVVYAVEVIARLFAEGGDAALAARLLGAADMIRAEEQVAPYPLFDAAGTLAIIRAALGTEGMEAQGEDGRRLAREELVAEALLAGTLADGEPIHVLTPQRPSASHAIGLDTLTPRQVDVLRLVAAGSSNREIGETLGISDRTVERHLTAIFGALDVDRRSAAVAKAGALGLL